MEKVLLIWNSNWADEMDISGFYIMEKRDWENYKSFLRDKTESFSIYVGTNQELQYDNGSRLLDEIESQEISELYAGYLNKNFEDGFGFLNFLEVD